MALSDVVALFPTPKAWDGLMGRPRTKGRPIEKSTHLGTIVTLLPTPLSSDSERGDCPGLANRDSPPLSAVSVYFAGGSLLPTPLAGDAKERDNPAQAARKSPPLNAVSAHFPDGRLLPTPVARPSGNSPEAHLRKKPGRQVVTDLAVLVENGLLTTGGKLLPTPSACDGSGGRGNSDGHQRTLPGTVSEFEVLPTPRAARGGSGTETMYALGGVRDDSGRPQGEVVLPTPRVSADRTSRRAAIDPGSRSSPSLEQAVEIAGGALPRELESWEEAPGSWLPTPTATERGDCPSERARRSPDIQAVSAHFPEDAPQWGKYEAAIRRWEGLTRPAPAPTEPNRNGRPRLSARFVEWMMGLPEGWVTGAGGISRAQQLKALGNGVCPQQAAVALALLLGGEGRAA